MVGSAKQVFKVPFLPARAKLWQETQKQLYILTGLKPAYSDKTIDDEPTEAYLCFRFRLDNHQKRDYEKTRVLFKIFDIDCFYESIEKVALIGVLEANFSKVANLFLPHDLTQKDWHTEPLAIDNMTSRERLTFFNLLFSLQKLDELERRNDKAYNLCKIMLRTLDIVSQNLNCIDHLQEHGIKVTINVSFASSVPLLPAFAAVKTESAPAAVVTPSPQLKMTP